MVVANCKKDSIERYVKNSDANLKKVNHDVLWRKSQKKYNHWISHHIDDSNPLYLPNMKLSSQIFFEDTSDWAD